VPGGGASTAARPRLPPGAEAPTTACTFTPPSSLLLHHGSDPKRDSSARLCNVCGLQYKAKQNIPRSMSVRAMLN